MKSLIERMENRKGTPKSWIAEVKKLQQTIKERNEKIAEYGDIIDVLARKVEAIEEKCKDLDFEAQELLATEKPEDLNRASAYHYSIDKIREVME